MGPFSTGVVTPLKPSEARLEPLLLFLGLLGLRCYGLYLLVSERRWWWFNLLGISYVICLCTPISSLQRLIQWARDLILLLLTSWGHREYPSCPSLTVFVTLHSKTSFLDCYRSIFNISYWNASSLKAGIVSQGLFLYPQYLADLVYGRHLIHLCIHPSSLPCD